MRQDNGRPSGMTVLEAVELGRLAHEGGDHARSVAWDMLRQMDLVDLAGRDCARLSGGEWQRVAFARTVAQVAGGKNAGVLLLDEPVSSLDPSHQHHLLGQARELSRSGYAVLAILHDLNLTACYADEVVMLRQGTVLENGPVAEMMTPEKLTAVYGCRIDAVENPEGKRALLSLP